MKNAFLAIDLGAGSGRAILGELGNSRLQLTEIHRFNNQPLYRNGHGYWDIDSLFREILFSLHKAQQTGIRIESIGIDTWGVDFSLLSAGNSLMQPFIYRDAKNDGTVELFTKQIQADRIYELTGQPLSQINTLFQLFSCKLLKIKELETAEHLLFMPDIFNYLLTGKVQTEYSIASTSQLLNPRSGYWEPELFSALGIPVSIMPEIVNAGTIIGRISQSICHQHKLQPVPVVAVASHDTASAVAAMPAENNNWVFLSTGTWCLMGYEAGEPLISRAAWEAGFTNEGGVGRTSRILKNLTGLWLLQECRRCWNEQHSFADLMELASAAKPFTSFIDTEAPEFLHPDDMPLAIREFCKKNRQYIPKTTGEIVRTILEGLAFRFRKTVLEITNLRGKRPEIIHMTGGGIRNELLCRFVADCTGIPVVTALHEAAATGNIMVQALALGLVNNVAGIRQITARSFPQKIYYPSGTDTWDVAWERYSEVLFRN